RTQALGTDVGAPRTPVQAQRRGDQHGVVGADAHGPHDAGMRVGDAAPITLVDPERRRPSRGPRRAVDVFDLGWRRGEIATERLVLGLVGAQFLLAHHGNLLEVLEAPDGRRVDTRLVPLATVERRVVPRVLHDLPDAFENRLVPLFGRHRLPAREPETLGDLGAVGLVVTRRPAPLFHHASPTGAQTPRIRSTIVSGVVSCPSTSATPMFLSSSTSSSGITPPATSAKRGRSGMSSIS